MEKRRCGEQRDSPGSRVSGTVEFASSPFSLCPTRPILLAFVLGVLQPRGAVGMVPPADPSLVPGGWLEARARQVTPRPE